METFCLFPLPRITNASSSERTRRLTVLFVQVTFKSRCDDGDEVRFCQDSVGFTARFTADITYSLQLAGGRAL